MLLTFQNGLHVIQMLSNPCGWDLPEQPGVLATANQRGKIINNAAFRTYEKPIKLRYLVNITKKGDNKAG
jgi:hypothetical protein